MSNNKPNCIYCCSDEDMRQYIVHDGFYGIYIDKHNNLENDLNLVLFNKEIKYCPMCGRKL